VLELRMLCSGACCETTRLEKILCAEAQVWVRAGCDNNSFALRLALRALQVCAWRGPGGGARQRHGGAASFTTGLLWLARAVPPDVVHGRPIHARRLLDGLLCVLRLAEPRARVLARACAAAGPLDAIALELLGRERSGAHARAAADAHARAPRLWLADAYAQYNKPAGLLHWLEQQDAADAADAAMSGRHASAHAHKGGPRERADFILLLESDMLLRRPIDCAELGVRPWRAAPRPLSLYSATLAC
jgi:hypothetical protein